MKIIKVIHGYPLRYNAGSEVYSQMLCQGLAERHEVHVFTRQENAFAADYTLTTETDHDDPRITLHVINMYGKKQKTAYQHQPVDQQFANLLIQLQPDIVHIGHLNHLSTSLITQAYCRHIPVVFTLHDYWLMCPRGQFIQQSGEDSQMLWPICTGQAHRKCALHCYSDCISGNPASRDTEITYWEKWVRRRMRHIQQLVRQVDYFIAPSAYLYQRFTLDFQLPPEKITYLDYGFDLKRFAMPRQRNTGEPFTFAYIGSHIPVKGIQYLLEAFSLLLGDCSLRIWGRANQHTVALQAISKQLPNSLSNRIEWMGEYQNAHIVAEVFNKIDCLVVPSIWLENSPLVIHEALQARVPVITANLGGMAEYIQHEVNGLLFTPRNATSLAQQMQRLLLNPSMANKLASRGYLASTDGNIPDMYSHLRQIEGIYHTLLATRKSHDYG